MAGGLLQLRFVAGFHPCKLWSSGFRLLQVVVSLVISWGQGLGYNIGALTITIGFWGPLYYSYNKEAPK